MREGIASAIAGIEAAATATASALRHAGWWLEWQARIGPEAGSRELAEADLAPAVQACESS